jgi:hypothetical protein
VRGGDSHGTYVTYDYLRQTWGHPTPPARAVDIPCQAHSHPLAATAPRHLGAEVRWRANPTSWPRRWILARADHPRSRPFQLQGSKSARGRLGHRAGAPPRHPSWAVLSACAASGAVRGICLDRPLKRSRRRFLMSQRNEVSHDQPSRVVRDEQQARDHGASTDSSVPRILYGHA